MIWPLLDDGGQRGVVWTM